ncbi:MAG: acyl-CoA dehydrogenase [Sphingomonadales bacterium]|nr:acyl-CoA dehydrogenase [Sphingomonadales bacterium]PIX67622.1 MAG: acyl-CoA dehydrogenase [Sphingomonadales bacterium CG_4_10_14_3_um_filter_58_15]NCO49824.1 acyl-CoA dehydrogenase [Sphingomonadales bacterium]NCO98631.1 acyl-CoA dehydrogenase [Sphingomonadales bacterium]NCP26311.1 acyl-CoA dehydrogenase [Sphingomonadales bacterium]
MSELEEFRTDVRAWLEENCPDEMRDGDITAEAQCWGGRQWEFQSEAQKIWFERALSKGYTVPSWPKEYGGAGLSTEQAKILDEERQAINARKPLSNFGISMLGPALLAYGTHEQKAQHLNGIARGEIRWCQGYSEPGAGSDLASLKTKCEDKGDHWLINGQKIWTSNADISDWIFCLVRTDFDAPKHEGITFILIDMASEGISVKPIVLISGHSPFCETFFDNVKVPKSYGEGNLSVVGEVNRGWDVAKNLLVHERGMLGTMSPLRGTTGPENLGSFAAEHIGHDSAGRLDDPALRQRIAQAQLDNWAYNLTVERMTDEANAGNGLGAKSSMLKYAASELTKRGTELRMDIEGTAAATIGADGIEYGSLANNWLYNRAYSILGGTTEVQLNIISKRVLGLPSQ